MSGLDATEAVRKTDHRIHDVGSAFMLHPETMTRSAESGYADPFAFYFAGRGGVLGDVDASVVIAAMGWFEPDMVRPRWEEGIAVAGAHEAARRYGAAAAAWGRDHLSGVDDVERLATLAEQLVAGAEPSGLPLFAGWRAEPLVDDAPGGALQLIHVLREWRGGLHLVATTAAGLSPLEAILTNEGERQARFFGWTGALPDCSHLTSQFEDAQRRTDTLSAAVYERALRPAERAEFAGLMEAAEAAAAARRTTDRGAPGDRPAERRVAPRARAPPLDPATIVVAAYAVVVAVGTLAASACTSGADQLDMARVRRAIDTRARANYPGVTLGRTRCPSTVDKRRGASFVCTVPVGGAALRIRVAQRDANGHVQFEAEQAVIQKVAAEFFVTQHASIAAMVTCGTQPVLVLAPGARFPCTVNFNDGTMQTVTVRVVDTAGTVVLEAPAKQ